MSTIKVDTVKNRSSAINLPNNFKIGGSNIVQGYTSSGSEPGSPSTGDFWWDSSNDKLYRYISGEFKELTLGGASAPVWGGLKGFTTGGGAYTNAAGSGDPQGPSNGNLTQIDYWTINDSTQATDFGDLNMTQPNYTYGASNNTRGVIASGYQGSGTAANQLDYITCATAGNASDFGDQSVERTTSMGAVGNGTRGIFGGGYSFGASGYVNTIDYVTIATTGNAVDFGDLLGGETGNTGVLKSGGYSNDETTGLFMGGHTQNVTTYQNRIQKITMATAGNASDHANLTIVNAYMVKGVISDNTTGLVGGGYSSNHGDIQSIDRFTIATGANATDHGDLPNAVADGGAASNGTQGEFFGSSLGAGIASGPNLDGRRYVVTIATAGNASLMGNLAIRWYGTAGFSGA